MDTATKQFLPNDVLSWVKVSGSAWRGNGFYYSRYPAPEMGKELSTKNQNHQVFYHQVGTPQSADELVFEDSSKPSAFNGVGTDEDERFAFLTRSDRSVKQGNSVFYRDDAKGEKEFKPLIPDIGDFNFGVLDFVNGKFLVSTNKGAKNRRIVAIDPAKPDEANWKTVRRREVHRDPMRWELEAGVADSAADAVAALPHAGIRKADHREDGHAERDVDLHVHRTGIDAEHRRRSKARKHADRICKRRRKSTCPVFPTTCGDLDALASQEM